MRLVTIRVGTNKITVPFRKNNPISIYVHPKEGVILKTKGSSNLLVIGEATAPWLSKT